MLSDSVRRTGTCQTRSGHADASGTERLYSSDSRGRNLARAQKTCGECTWFCVLCVYVPRLCGRFSPFGELGHPASATGPGKVVPQGRDSWSKEVMRLWLLMPAAALVLDDTKAGVLRRPVALHSCSFRTQAHAGYDIHTVLDSFLTPRKGFEDLRLRMDGLYLDPNCSQHVAWSSWRSRLDALDLGALAGEPTEQGRSAQAAEDAALELGLGPDPGCFLGSSTLLLAQVAGAWRRGRFVAALHTFAVLHDHFLTAAHPGFFLHSAWPVGDQDVRFWKDRLLFQVRRFRELVGRDLHRGRAFEQISDPVERENLGGFAAHVAQQMRANSSQWSWQLSASAALVPGRQPPPVRVYVYGEAEVEGLGRLTRAPAFCHYRQWGMDVGFHDFFRTSPVRTFDPDAADYFFVASYACCHQVGPRDMLTPSPRWPGCQTLTTWIPTL